MYITSNSGYALERNTWLVSDLFQVCREDHLFQMVEKSPINTNLSILLECKKGFIIKPSITVSWLHGT